MSARYKDVNECLMDGLGADLVRQCLLSARDFAPEKVVHASAFEEAYLSEWFEKGLDSGLQLPWGVGDFFIRPGEMTLWLGVEGSGKSTMLEFVLVCLLAQGERALIASLETTVAKTMQKMARQALGDLIYSKKREEKLATEEERQEYRALGRGKAQEAFEWLAPNLWFYHHVGIAPWRPLLEDMGWARRRHGVTQFVADNFMRLGILKDDYAQQAEAVTAFASAAMEWEAHVHLVLHQNKSERGKGEGGGKHTAAGAFEILANAHNIVEVKRDEAKAQKVADLWEKRKIGQIGTEDFEKQKAALDLVPDGKFVLHKQRNGEQQNGSKYLWFLWESQQYADKPAGHKDHAAIRFVAESLAAGHRGKEPELPDGEPLITANNR